MPQKKFIIQPSNMLLIFLIFIHIGVVPILWFLLNFLILKSMCIICLGAHFFISWRKYFKHRKIQEISLNMDKTWSLRSNTELVYEATLGGSSVVTNFVLLLHFWTFKDKIAKKRAKFLPVIIFRDALAVEDFRQLKVILRTSKCLLHP